MTPTPPEQDNPTHQAPHRGFGLGAVLLALATGVIIGVGAVLIVGELDPPRPTEAQEIDPQALSQWRQARERWDTRGPRDYRFVYSTSAYVAATRTQVEVRGTTITLTPLDPDAYAGTATGRTAPTIDGLFATVQNEQRLSDTVTVDYHPELGYPTRIDIDSNARGADDEFHILIGDLQPLPPV